MKNKKTKDFQVSDDKLDKFGVLAYLVALIDGITEDEGWSLDQFAGKVRFYYPLRKAVEAFEKTGDIDKAMKHVNERPIMMHVMGFGQPAHLKEIDEELSAVSDENPLDDYRVLIKIKASEIDDEFDQKLALILIEDTVSEDGLSSPEISSLLLLSRCWGVSRKAADIWFDNYFAPILERTMKLPHKDPDLDELAKENAEGPIMVEHYD